MEGDENNGRAIAVNQPKFTSLRRSLSAPTIEGTGVESRIAMALGPANRRTLVSPACPAATPRTSTGFASFGFDGSATKSSALCSVTTVRLSMLSGMNTAPKYELLAPTQL